MATYVQLINAKEVLDDLTKLKMPPRVSLKLARNARVLYEALGVFDGVVADLKKAYAKHDKDGAIIIGDEGVEWNDYDAFQAEFGDALETDAGVTFEVMYVKHFPKNIEFDAGEAIRLADAGLIQD